MTTNKENMENMKNTMDVNDTKNTEDDIKIKLVKWTPVGTYSFNIEETECSICKYNLMESCSSCLEMDKISPDVDRVQKCVISKGKCGHCFHYHCIAKWIKDDVSCPIDRVPFEYDKTNIDKIQTMKKPILKKDWPLKTKANNFTRKGVPGGPKIPRPPRAPRPIAPRPRRLYITKYSI